MFEKCKKMSNKLESALLWSYNIFVSWSVTFMGVDLLEIRFPFIENSVEFFYLS